MLQKVVRLCLMLCCRFYLRRCPVPRFELARLPANWKPSANDLDCSGAQTFTTSVKFDVQVLRTMATQDWLQAKLDNKGVPVVLNTAPSCKLLVAGCCRPARSKSSLQRT